MRRTTELARWGAATMMVLTVTACAPGGGTAAAQDPPARSSNDRPAGAADTGEVDPNCTKATKVAIVADGDAYAFSPRELTIRRGAFLAVTNKSDRVHPLLSTPDAGIATSVLDLKERQVIQFPEAGTFTVRSAATGRRNALHVTVSGESGCDAPKPTLTISNGYAITPAKLTVRSTENILVVNESAGAHTMSCTPDPGGNRDHPRADRGETLILAIDAPGRYTCASLQHPDATATVTVE